MFKSALDLADCADMDCVALPPIALRELTMLRFMDQFSDEPHWDEKVLDQAIAHKWKAEVLTEAAVTDVDITQKMVDWCIEELRYKAKIFQKTGAISVYTGDVVKSDTIVPKTLRDRLKAAAASLEDIPNVHKDWRPGSDRTILDLVHPSFYPLVYGRTRILIEELTTLDDFIDRCGNGRVLPTPPDDEAAAFNSFFNPDISDESFSRRFQWLPCEVDVSGKHARITSYINNLNPQKHKDLYQVIEQIISHAIPMWNMTLTPLGMEEYRYTRLTYDGCKYDPDFTTPPESEGPQMRRDEDEDDYWDRREEWILETRRRWRIDGATQPDAGEFQPPSVPQDMRKKYLDRKTKELRPKYTVNLRRDFLGLQVIVKLANIHLTPDKPEYAGGIWHVDGQPNEHICATALYCYDSVNVTKNLLTFRQQCICPEGIMDEQDEHDLQSEIFGISLGQPAIQEIGSIETKEGRLITFPNIFQHRAQPFSLADPSKPGHCKVLALYLVDPHIRIISTANVPCQRRDWWREKVIRGGPRRLVNLPLELQDLIFEQIDDFPISMEKAKKLRLELMEDHHAYADIHSKAFMSSGFSFED
ncbi:hypothetical protein BD779DRAFT_1646453 [Infundibulicybe gibba]|nr:hypothetical protein BD779DRAFT_1646453 [Infundibulicybe gibba]